ncbi:hypothetical protein H2200_012230 [Cladophialophora chaetospira]|uniref:NmrA-like domain-containing protein n=1 Tax=Cladophialophora chaetospira TaxID=386627 RepID=A0AA38WYH4_9EURO|nr:hypothetical protein H2200_012230 [Cladophialophora chaetospira]
MAELIVFTCASGKQCSHIIPLLYRDPPLFKFRLVVHSESSLKSLSSQYPDAEVVRRNLGNPEECSEIVDCAAIVYFIGPTFHPHEAQFGFNMIDASVRESRKPNSKLSHFIFSSVLHPEITKLLNHDRKRQIEEYLCESPLKYTILQPSHFADNAMGRLLSLKDSPDPVFVAAHDPEVAFSFSCLRDHAEVSEKIIRERSKHFYATYQLASTWPMKYSEYVQSVGQVLGKTIKVQQMPCEEVVDMYCSLVFGAKKEVDQRFKDGPERLLLYYNKRGIVGSPSVLEWLLGRPGTTPAQLAASLLS